MGRAANPHRSRRVYLLPRVTSSFPIQARKDLPLFFPGTPLFAIYESAAALERAEASARVLAARASLPPGSGRAFAELSSNAPEGLIPTPGRGAAHVARQLARASDMAAGAQGLLGAEVVDAFDLVAAAARRVASTSDALDPGGTARAARRGVATVRGLVAATIDRDGRWEAFRLGTHLPRAGWLTALARAAAEMDARGAGVTWQIAGTIASVPVADGDVARRLLSDLRSVGSVAFAVAESEAAVLALARDGEVNGAALPLAREARSRLRVAADDPGAVALDDLLDALGALAAAVDPTVTGPARRRDPSAA